MPLPEPKLDDRTFQMLVNEAKSLIPRYCPEWTDHNVSDPGVTLIELFSWMVDVLLYRLNRVPEKNYIRFMDLLGIRLQGANAAQVPISFWLSTPQQGPVTIKKGTEVATIRTGDQPALTFAIDDDLVLFPPKMRNCLSSFDEQNFVDQTPKLDLASEFFDAFQRKPVPGDSLYFGFDENIGRHTISLNVDCQVQGIGVDPRDPPLVWQVWCGSQSRWVRVEVDSDQTGGFNKSGNIVLFIPPGLQQLNLGNQNRFWLRVQVVPSRPQQPMYSVSPRINTVKAVTVGGTMNATHATAVKNESLGRSDGTPGQRFKLENTPVLKRELGEAVEVQNQNGDWVPWKEVLTFSEADSNSTVYMLDPTTGTIDFGPSIRQPDGRERQYGAIPSKNSSIRFSRYRFGGGVVGNVGANTISVLKTSIPFIARVTNRSQANGGLDPESIEAAKMRVPKVIRSRNRAVTSEDFEFLARESSTLVGRARCIPIRSGGADGGTPGTVELLVVPAVPPGERITLKSLQPTSALIDEVRKYLDERRLITTNLIIDTPSYIGVAVEADVVVRQYVNAERVQNQVIERLFNYMNPLYGGPEGTGWPFGRDLYLSEVLTLIQSVPGVEFVQDATLYQIDSQSGQAKAAGQKVTLSQDALIISYSHKVTIKNLG